jgi:hypothetical protein
MQSLQAQLNQQKVVIIFMGIAIIGILMFIGTGQI